MHKDSLEMIGTYQRMECSPEKNTEAGFHTMKSLSKLQRSKAKKGKDRLFDDRLTVAPLNPKP